MLELSSGEGVGVRLIAFFLTQFHPIPENDAWWGKGFTEWTNTTKARPLFPGHYQPHLPADLGFYDLRLRRSRQEQISLAKQFGIDGFCYHYYWFSGRRVLEQPLNDMLADPDSDMPFCLCWANETWTRRWDGAEHEVLLGQQYRDGDDLRFIVELEPVLRDRRYIRHRGAPLLIVYQPQSLPDPAKTVKIWRDHCRAAGIPELHICAALTHGNWDYQQFGFDSGVEFPPHNLKTSLDIRGIGFYRPFRGHIFDYRDIAEFYLERPRPPGQRQFRTVFPSWDNTARRKDSAVVVINGTPENYEHWLARAIAKTEAEFPEGGGLVFINAWNEWAEGCHLEPDQKYGRQFLEATLRARHGNAGVSTFAHVGIPKQALAIPASSARKRGLLQVLGRSLPKLSWGGQEQERRKQLKRKVKKFRAWSVSLQAEIDLLKDGRAQDQRHLSALMSEQARLQDEHARLVQEHAALSDAHRLLSQKYAHESANRQNQPGLADPPAPELMRENAAGNRSSFGAAGIDAHRLRDLYLRLMLESLVGGIHRDPSPQRFGAEASLGHVPNGDQDRPPASPGMIERRRLENLRQLCERAIQDKVSGDFFAAGARNGWACVLLRGVIEAYGDVDRRVWVAESFDEPSPLDTAEYPKGEEHHVRSSAESAISQEEVRAILQRVRLPDNRIAFLKGRLKGTLRAAPFESLAVLHLGDGRYESTMDALNALYRKVSPNGFVIIDHQGKSEACRLIVADFCRNEQIQPAIEDIDGACLYWRKT